MKTEYILLGKPITALDYYFGILFYSNRKYSWRKKTSEEKVPIKTTQRGMGLHNTLPWRSQPPPCENVLYFEQVSIRLATLVVTRHPRRGLWFEDCSWWGPVTSAQKKRVMIPVRSESIEKNILRLSNETCFKGGGIHRHRWVLLLYRNVQFCTTCYNCFSQVLQDSRSMVQVGK